MTNVIAIKLGSSNSSIFKLGEGIVLFEPSLVAYTGSGKEREIKAFGSRAKKMLGRTDEFTYVSSPIKEGRIIDTDLAVSMLKFFLGKVMPASLFRPKVKAIVCIPMGLTDKERKAYEKVCYHSGIHDYTLVPSIVCGAIGYNLPVSEPSGLCLVNIGGGSTDIAVVSADSIISGINVNIGGELLDRAIEKEILKEHNIVIGAGVAEDLKEDIGSLFSNDASNAEVTGVDQETKLTKSVVVESRTIYDAIIPYFEKLVKAIKAVLNACPPNILEDVYNKGIYFMGGTSFVVGLEQYFRRALNLPALVQDETTAIDVIGAGKLLHDAKQIKKLSEL